MFGRFEELANIGGGKDIYEYDEDGNVVQYRPDSELSTIEGLHIMKDDLCFSAANFPGNVIGSTCTAIVAFLGPVVTDVLNLQRESTYDRAFEYVLGNLEQFKEEAHDPELLEKLQSIGAHQGGVAVSLLEDGGVEITNVKFTSEEKNRVLGFHAYAE